MVAFTNLGGGTAFQFSDLCNRSSPTWTQELIVYVFTQLLPLGLSQRIQPSLKNASWVLWFNWELDNFRTPYTPAHMFTCMQTCTHTYTHTQFLLQHPECGNTYTSFWSRAFDPGNSSVPFPFSLWAPLQLTLTNSSWIWPKSDIISSVRPEWSESQVHSEGFRHCW